MAGLEWRRNKGDVLIATMEEAMFFRIAPGRSNGDCSLWLIRRSDHPLGGLRDCLGRFASEEDARLAAEGFV